MKYIGQFLKRFTEDEDGVCYIVDFPFDFGHHVDIIRVRS